MNQFQAAVNGDLDWFLSNKINADLACNDAVFSTALMYACEDGHYEIVEHLLNEGASINKRDSDGWNALVYAVGEGHNDIVMLMLSRGANTVMESLVEFEQISCVKYAIEYSQKTTRVIIEKFIQTPRTLKFHMLKYFSKIFKPNPKTLAPLLLQWNDYAKETVAYI